MRSDGTKLEIVQLQSRPEFIEAAAKQNFEQWGEFTGIDERTMTALFAADNAIDTLDATFIALIDGRYAGCVSLREKTMGIITHPEVYLDKSPWLSNMWVADWARGHGLASKLTASLEDLARTLGISRVYSSTAHADSLYHKLGYVDIEQRPFKGETIYLIYKDM